MKLKGITLLETVVSLLIISIISLSASAAYSTAGNIFRHTEDIREQSADMAEKMAEIYLDYNVRADNICRFKINDDITIEGEVMLVTAKGSEPEEYIAVRPVEKEVVESDDEETAED